MRLWTPTQLIYHAAIQTPKVTTPRGKVVEYVPFSAEDTKDSVCYLCGGDTHGKGQLIKKAIKPTFTDTPYAKALASQTVCEGCAFCLSRRELRNYAIVATETELLHPSREQIRGMMLEPPEPPFVICIAVSGQKWVHFKSQVNYNRESFVVNLEESQIVVEPDRLKPIVNAIEHLYTVFSKDEILTGRYNQKRIRNFGLTRFSDAEDAVTEYRGAQLFELAVFIAQKQEEEEVVVKNVRLSESDPRRKTVHYKPAQLRFSRG